MWKEWSRPLPPCLVLNQSTDPWEFPMSVPAWLASGTATVEARWEDGTTDRCEVRLDPLPKEDEVELRGERFVRKRLRPPFFPRLGYHDLAVRVRTEESSVTGAARLIICPDRAWTPPQLTAGGRLGGIAISLYGLRSMRNWGCGDFTDLERLIDWAAEDAGCGFIALNPLHAISNRQPFNTSPYLPNCIYYRNPIYLDVERVEDFQHSRRARTLFASPEVQSEIGALRAEPFVEYERVYALKLRFLRLAFGTFLEEFPPRTSRAKEFREWCEREGELLDLYATYLALDEWIHAKQPDLWVWPQWSEEYRDAHSGATRQFTEQNAPAILFHKYVQWQVALQLGDAHGYAQRRGMPIGLYHDLALATDRCGSDLWAHRDFYVAGCRVGSPPDGFSPDGQDWAFPPPNAERHRESGYRLIVESIRKNSCFGGALRIDHVMRFFRLFWIPDGMRAAEGAYVRDFHEDLLRILALESVRNRVLIVGEDLGTVEPVVREQLERFGILGCRLLYFERDGQGSFKLPREYPRQALVSVTTHDLPTLAGFWRGRDIEARRDAGMISQNAFQQQMAARMREKQKMLDALRGLDLLPEWFPRSAPDVPELTGELHDAITGFLASTPSMLMAVAQEDLTKEAEQQNLPGTTWQHPNWRRKMRYTVEELRTDRTARDFTAMFRNWLERTGRCS